MNTADDRPRDVSSGPVSSVPRRSEPPGWFELLGAEGSAALSRIAEIAAVGGGSAGGESARGERAQAGASLRAQGVEPDLIAAALTLAELRDRAESKFGELAHDMFLTRAGLEQASRLAVAESHARRFAAAGCTAVADLGCGLGAESLAFLRAGLAVRAVEIDPLTAAFAERNLAVQAAALADPPPFEVICADATTAGTNTRERAADGVFLDPARRTAGHRDTRRVSSDAYSPSLDFAFAAARSARAGGVKLGPGFDRALIPDDAEAQWVSVNGQLVEMALWFGSAARDGVKRAATVIDRTSTHELLASSDSPDAEIRPLGEYLIEPDGAVIRARLIGRLAAELGAGDGVGTGAGMIHPGIAYLTSDRRPDTPFAQSFRVLEELPVREKELRRELARRGIGALEIKKRGADVDPAALRTRLRLKGPERATLILTRAEGRHVALLAERV